MKQRLIITEKTSIADRISEILSERRYIQRSTHYGYAIFEFTNEHYQSRVIALQGHSLELNFPKKLERWTVASVREMTTTDPIYQPKNLEGLEMIYRFIREAEEILVATDYDREGELIAGELFEFLGIPLDDPRITRARFSTLDQKEILRSFDQAGPLDQNLVRAGQIRQVLDLLWGAGFTRLYTIFAKGSMLSVGRVQSPTLVELVHREKSIERFVPETYWKLQIDLRDRDGIKALDFSQNPIKQPAECDRLKQILHQPGLPRLLSTDERVIVIPRGAPLNTTDALVLLTGVGMSADQAMRCMETLYSRGYLSYPRTDNQVFSKDIDLREILLSLRVSTEYGSYIDALLEQPPIIPPRGKKEQTDHPPIYPLKIPPSSEPAEIRKCFNVLLKHFLVLLSPDATVLERTQTIEIEQLRFEYQSFDPQIESWFVLRDPGIPLDRLPLCFEPTPPMIERVRFEQKQTKPPARYTQGTILRFMERQNIGTKSTRHTILNTLQQRGYTDQRAMCPTPLGIRLATILEQHTATLATPRMTATLEEQMDLIAAGQIDSGSVRQQFRDEYAEAVRSFLANEESIRADLSTVFDQNVLIGPCTQCSNGNLRLRGQITNRFIGCDRYPECTNILNLVAPNLLSLSEERCPVCGFLIGLFEVPSVGRLRLCVSRSCPSFVTNHPYTQPCPECQKAMELRIFRTGVRLFCATCKQYGYLRDRSVLFELFEKDR